MRSRDRVGSGLMKNLRAGEYGPLERLGKIFSNVGRKVTRMQSCCGNYGEPGC